MPDVGLINEWKEEFSEIYSVTVGGTEYIFRALTFREYDSISSAYESMAEAEEIIIDEALLWPNTVNYSKLKAGHISSIADEILEVSGFTDIEAAQNMLAQKREAAQSFRFNMKAFVLATQPFINEASLDDLTFSQLATKVAMAERIIAIQQAMFGIRESGVQLEIIDPEEETAPQTVPLETRDLKDVPLTPDYKPSNLGAAVAGDPIAAKLKQALGG